MVNIPMSKETKISEDFPPNFEKIKAKFPNLEAYKPVFTYGSTVFNPFKTEITPDLLAHECTHVEQQGEEPEQWWDRYLTDDQFRLEQETEAYAYQFKFIKDKKPPHKIKRWYLEKMAFALSGELYGNMLPYQIAEASIRNFFYKEN